MKHVFVTKIFTDWAQNHITQLVICKCGSLFVPKEGRKTERMMGGKNERRKKGMKGGREGEKRG